MKIRSLALSFLLVLAALPAYATAPVAKIEAMLSRPKVLCGRFEQSKQLVGIKKPVLSSGRFCIVNGKGVLWRTLQPFPSSLKLTANEIVQTQGERVAMRLDANRDPVVRMINGVLFSLLGGDLSQLEKMFEVDGSVRDQTWSVQLKARDAALAKAISGIVLEGGKYVSNITITDGGGDRTAIVFRDFQTGDTAMQPEEAGQF